MTTGGHRRWYVGDRPSEVTELASGPRSTAARPGWDLGFRGVGTPQGPHLASCGAERGHVQRVGKASPTTPEGSPNPGSKLRQVWYSVVFESPLWGLGYGMQ